MVGLDFSLHLKPNQRKNFSYELGFINFSGPTQFLTHQEQVRVGEAPKGRVVVVLVRHELRQPVVANDREGEDAALS